MVLFEKDIDGDTWLSQVPDSYYLFLLLGLAESPCVSRTDKTHPIIRFPFLPLG